MKQENAEKHTAQPKCSAEQTLATMKKFIFWLVVLVFCFSETADKGLLEILFEIYKTFVYNCIFMDKLWQYEKHGGI